MPRDHSRRHAWWPTSLLGHRRRRSLCSNFSDLLWMDAAEEAGTFASGRQKNRRDRDPVDIVWPWGVGGCSRECRPNEATAIEMDIADWEELSPRRTRAVWGV